MADKFGNTTEGRLERIELQLDAIELALRASVISTGDTLNRVEVLLNTIQQEELHIMAEQDDLVAEIEDVKGVQDSAVVLITRLLDQVGGLVQNATDLATLKTQVAAATASLKANAQPLADAVAANP